MALLKVICWALIFIVRIHIVSVLKSEHGIEMSVRTLKRRLKSYNLSRRVDLEEDGNFNQEYIRNLI